MAVKSKTRGANLPVPQNREEASAAVRVIGELNRDIARITADMNDELAAVKERYENAAAPLRERSEAATEGLKMWAEANRSTLTGGDKTKTVDLGTGEIKWRLRPPSVRLRGEDTVIEKLRALGLGRFIRTKVEVNKEALKAEPDVARTVAGVSISSGGEDFVVEPFEAALTAQPAA
ncbi:Uncharacterised protein [Starkeya nomas]|uniref:Host-nuclease inhibitor protein Gam n=1 Tax=Starkeya nomas TaxID=2666134 RepID=A0A5S9R5I5_9HYPH|nr:host-nuclease inhibitor Gam family protein [Starkeya nomas]CAA0130246.1 Uncharacterised protein [Starkeya nomas]